MVKKTALGRGLGSLISGGVTRNPKQDKKSTGKAKKHKAAAAVLVESPAAVNPVLPGTVAMPQRMPEPAFEQNGLGVYELPLARIIPNPHQPRKDFSAESLHELAESIRSEGLLQPVVVRRKEADRYELIAGERRWRACQMLKLKVIPARVMQATEISSAVLSLIENLQREDLNPLEEAMGYASLIKDFDLTQEQVAERIGRNRASIANILRLLQLPAEIQSYLTKGHLSTGHAKVLLGVEGRESQLLLARQIIEQGWSVRELERQVDRVKSGRPASAPRNAPAAEIAAIRDLQNQIANALSTPVTLKHAPRKGRIVIEYFGNDDLQRILERMGVRV